MVFPKENNRKNSARQKKHRIVIDRFRVQFTKEGDIRFTSHLDLMRLLERAVRRSGLPAKMTEGFNPHVKMSFPFALPVGMESHGEIMDLYFPRNTSPNEVRTRLSATLPAGIRVLQVKRVPGKPKSQISSSYYRICFGEEDVPGEKEIREFLSRDSLLVTRKKGDNEQTRDILPYIIAIEVEEKALKLQLLQLEGKTARVEEVIRLLGRDPLQCRMTRTHLRFLTELPDSAGGKRHREEQIN